MEFLHKGPWKFIISLLLALILIVQTYVGVCNNDTCMASGTSCFLNDRAADIAGSTPLLAPGLLNSTGLSGQGQIIGIADSGLDKGSISDIHLDLQSEAGKMPKVAMLKSYSGRTVPDDPNGHGTHMAATIAGSGQASEGKYRGIAPGASLYFQALLDQEDQLRIPPNLDQLFRPAYAAGVRIHVNGWGNSGNAYTGNSAQIDNFVYEHPDFLPVFGAGNSGPGAATITGEANSKNALAVGSSQIPRPAFSNEARYVDQAAGSSSRGPAQDGRIKPELLAPGSAVISACSSLTTSNFQPDSKYTLMGGSSMAAAVTGGSLALLREYLNTHKGINNPSSALLKSLLVNGAKDAAGGPSNGCGFGILDLLGTVLALHEERFNLVEEPVGIHSGETREYKLHLDSGEAPFKVTLAWVDPPAKSGASSALVNNLDLLVRDPHGKIYYGNDFLQTGNIDQVNNIEQISIPKTITGEYTVIIKGANLDANYPAQAFALVYGQPLQQGIVQGIDKNGNINLLDDSKLDLTSLKTNSVVNGQKLLNLEQVAAGSDIYWSSKAAYFLGRKWEASGVQVLTESNQKMLLEINIQDREGGFFIEPQALADGEPYVWLNSQPLAGVEEIPVGATVHTCINPGHQTVWQIEAEYDEVHGFVEKLSPDKREIKLVQNNNAYIIAQNAAISYSDQLVDCDDLNAPYGSAETASLDELAPGMRVSLAISPADKEVKYIKVSRDLVIGEVQAVNANMQQMILDTGKSYKIFPGVQLFKDGQKVNIDDIEPGIKIAALLLPGTDDIIQLQAISNIAYGRVAYVNAKDKTLYLFDHKNQFKIYELKQEAEVFKRGIQVNASSIESGMWVRIVLGKSGKQIWRVDIAEALPAESKVLFSNDLEQKVFTMDDDTSYTYSAFTSFIKAGYMVSPDLILPGDKLVTSMLESIYQHSPFLARVEAVSQPDARIPELKADAYALNGVLIIQGNSNASRIILYRGDGSHTDITAGPDGSFSAIYTLQENEREVRILAMDSLSGGIKGIDLKILDFPVPQGDSIFIDISGDPAEQHIINLSKRGIISGYGDGTFRPGQLLTRAEFITIMARTKNWDIEASAAEPCYFKDNRQIPWWAVGAVYAARNLGLISGYP
ncbi:MAG: S8 family serine peptidase, partial [Syntrophomonadaceae bacterium]|nr:S8 family serine peptidase [Syntrophomonadaceae bacterium]